ncbi:Rrp15p-domain-containing protein [Mucidula mucida]|nr:Rrp15p-domain-containing protein [Mucidula mucida]
MSNPPPKRQRLSEEKESSVGSANDDDSGSGMSEDVSGDEEEILNLKPTKSQQTKKRKIRATGTSNFGATLQSLLSTEAPTDLPLSLKPSLARRRNDEKLESKAKKVLQLERKEKEDKNRITDVIGGWGGESERALRKVAQRGVVKLFNAVQQSQTAAANTEEEKKAAKGSGKPRLAAPTIEGKMGKKSKKDNLIGRGKPAAVEKDDFFDMIRSGGIVSKV